jgi:type IV pilus biogenesis protein CpaD/CtpE
MAYELVETIEVGSGGAASIEFTSIPQTGVDLLLVASSRNTGSIGNLKINLNNDTGANYAYLDLYGTGSSASSSSGSSFTSLLLRQGDSGDTANTFSNSSLYISNYTSSTAKSVSADAVSENNGSSAVMNIMAQNYATSSGVTSMQIASYVSGNLEQYSSFSLYIIS